MENWKEIKKEFLNKWTLDKVKNLKLEEYTNLEKNDSFTYWLETKTSSVLGIGGGSAYKFGIFKRNVPPLKLKSGQADDGTYGWYEKYGSDCKIAFDNIKFKILSIIEASQNKQFQKIDSIDIGETVKWKIAYMYAPDGKLLRIASRKAFNFLAKKYNIKSKKISEIQQKLIAKKPVNIDFDEYSSSLWDKYWKSEEVVDNLDNNKNEGVSENISNQSLNQILYGPPGTGKTYHTINKTLEIIFELPDNYYTLSDEEKEKKLIEISGEVIEKNKIEISTTKKDLEREKLKKVFDYYTGKGQIEFVTFHQSYGYEEFVEGIKAKTETDEETKKKFITYDVESGIFKELCDRAKKIKIDKQVIYDFSENINIWKISLGDSQNSEDDFIFDYCIENNKILLGFGDNEDYSNCKNRNEIADKMKDNKKQSYPPTAVNTIKNKMKKNDIVLVSYGNKKLRAIAKIIGDYKYLNDDNLGSYQQSRKVEWLLIPDESFSYEKILKKQFSQMSIYDIKKNVKLDALKEFLTKKELETSSKNYILIIDEINRGNISKIFGELITLIEPSKRIGEDEALHVKLPYSGDDFGVPNNLYIIGTMNTADRSIALMDTALRRRFEFSEMMPKSDLVDFSVEKKISIKNLLETINKRIEYLYDRDHTIGHSYFMELDSKSSIEDLGNIFKNKIIPLLQEYFYDDWEKIRLVLGDNRKEEKYQFVKVKKDGYSVEKLFDDSTVFDFDEDKKVYEINQDAFNEEDSYKIAVKKEDNEESNPTAS